MILPKDILKYYVGAVTKARNQRLRIHSEMCCSLLYPDYGVILSIHVLRFVSSSQICFFLGNYFAEFIVKVYYYYRCKMKKYQISMYLVLKINTRNPVAHHKPSLYCTDLQVGIAPHLTVNIRVNFYTIKAFLFG